MYDEQLTQRAVELSTITTGEEVESVREQYSSTLMFTSSWVVKFFLGESPERALLRYQWLKSYGTLECRAERLRHGHEQFTAIVMERLPDELCVSTMLSNNALRGRHVGRVIRRLATINLEMRRPPVPVRIISNAVIENIEKQARLMRNDPLGTYSGQVLAAGRRVISMLPTAADSWTPVAHGDLHAENVFVLPDRVPLIDPVFSEPRARLAPNFVELTPLYADLLAYGRADLARRLESEFLAVATPSLWPLFLLYTCLKILVRYRVARQTPKHPGHGHRSSGAWWSDAATTTGLLDNVLAELAGGAVAGPRPS